MNRAGRWLLLLSLVGCGPSTPESSASTGGESASSPLQQLNARARAGAVTETLHGVEVDDPYRALEEDSELTRAWVNEQTARTQSVLDRWRDPDAAERLATLLSIGVLGAPRIRGTRIFYTKREGDREQPALYLRDNGTLRETPLIDPLTYGERASLDWYFPSPSGRYIAFGISSDGDERSTLRVYDVERATVLDDTLEHCKWSAVTWLHSEAGFYYRRYPREGEPHHDPAAEDTYHMALFFHRLGSAPSEDTLVFAPAEGTDFPSAELSEDDRWLVVNNYRGWSASDVRLFDRGSEATRIAPDEGHPFVEVVVGQPHLYTGEVHHDRLFLTHNDGAPRYRVDAVPLSEAADRAAWRTVVAESEGAIEGVDFLDAHLVVHRLENIASRVRLFGLDGEDAGTIELPDDGELFGLDAEPDSGRVVYGFSSFLHPPTLYSWSREANTSEVLDQVETDLDLSELQLSRASVPSADGTPINVFYVHRRDLARDGSARVLLNGYGGFNVSLQPGFQRNAVYWVERGGVYAVANLRGGGEFGEQWHQAGNLANKERVFEDFEAVIRWLGGDSGISSPSRIAITGGSNGGLLMGAMLTRAPDSFAATVSGVGLYDMVRYHRFPPAELWVTEYGSAEDATQFGWLHAYSPYHRVNDGTAYPAALITTADHDTRVHWAHSTKFTARLQEATGLADPAIYFFMVRSVGHGAGTRLSDTVERYVRLYSFVDHHLAH